MGPAERSFRRAIELDPRDLLWRDHFAYFLLLPVGRVEEAIGQLRVAEEIDPLSPQTHSALSSALRSAGRYDEALFHCQKAAQNDQQRSVCWAQNLMQQGKNEEAVRILEPVWSGHLLEPAGITSGWRMQKPAAVGMRSTWRRCYPGSRVKHRSSPRWATRTEHSNC